MLYLPAGWFHEVFSSNDGSSEGHCAFNFWFHPPDNINALSSNSPADGDGDAQSKKKNKSKSKGEGKAANGMLTAFEKPYVSDFWQRDLASRGL